jgi:hypothetical protein
VPLALYSEGKSSRPSSGRSCRIIA